MLTAAFPTLLVNDHEGPWMIHTCETCGWEWRFRMLDIHESYAGVGDHLWRIHNHYVACAASQPAA